MLLSQPVITNDIVTMKLISGEELIAKFISEDATTFTVSKPLVLAQGQNGMILAPFVMTAEAIDSVPFMKSCVIIPPVKTQTQVQIQLY